MPYAWHTSLQKLVNRPENGALRVVTMSAFQIPSPTAPPTEPDRQWFALHVETKHSDRVELHLAHKGFETFAPQYTVTKLWSDRKRRVALPLFPGYLFARLHENDRMPVLVTPGVYSIVGCGRQPIPISDLEISSLREVTRSGLPFEPCAYLTKGERVTIAEGALAGLTGIVVEVKKTARVVLSIDLIQRAVAVEVDATMLASTTSRHTPAA